MDKTETQYTAQNAVRSPEENAAQCTVQRAELNPARESAQCTVQKAGQSPAGDAAQCRVQEVPLEHFPGIRIGQAEDAEGGTGVTVVLSEDPKGMAAGLHIGGGGPATRETGILNPVTTAQRIHAAVLGGGSAFGLDAAGGVMRYLEEKGIGVEVRGVHVPLVTQVDIFDLPVGDPGVRPDQAMGYAACLQSETGVHGEKIGEKFPADPARENGATGKSESRTLRAGKGNYRDGNHGAGCGASIGKYAGVEHAMKSGIGACVLRHGDLLVGAIIAVNAFGDIYDWKNGCKIAGAHAEDGRMYDRMEMISMLRKMEEMRGAAPACNPGSGVPERDSAAMEEQDASDGMPGRANIPYVRDRLQQEAEAALNTTIGIIFTNAPFQKPQLCKIAAMAHDGFARSIAPVHTSGDGDSIIALSVTTDEKGRRIEPAVCAGIDTVGSLAAWAASEAILRGVRSASSAYGLTALCDLCE